MNAQTNLSSLFAIGCALSWAICTFAAGRISTKISSKLLVIIFNFAAAIYFFAISDFRLDQLTTRFALMAIAAGICHACALSLIGHSLAKGRSGVIAPTSTVLEITVPVMAATIFAKSFGLLTYLGIIILISSVFLLRKADNESHETSIFTDLIFGLLSGVGFGLAIAFLSFVSNEAKNNAFALMQLSSIMFLTALLVYGKLKRPDQKIGLATLKEPFVAKLAFIFVFFELLGNIFLNLALKEGNGGIVAALASIPYAIGIILLSVVLLKEKISKLQFLGILVAIAGIAITHLSTV